MDATTLSSWANVADIIGAVSILGGLVFGIFQLRHYRGRQRDAAATNLTQTFYSKDLADALALLQEMPDGVSLDELRAFGPEYVKAATTVSTSFETMGLLVFKRVVSLDLVMDLCGGIIKVQARKLQQYQNDVRRENSQPSWGEWFEWLGDQAEKLKSSAQPAYIEHKNWRP
jgi:hypothetical protein